MASRLEVSKYLNVRFREYVQGGGAEESGVAVDVSIMPAQQEWGLQAADMVVWAVYQKYENGDGVV